MGTQTQGEWKGGEGRGARGSVFMVHGSRFAVHGSRFTVHGSWREGGEGELGARQI